MLRKKKEDKEKKLKVSPVEQVKQPNAEVKAPTVQMPNMSDVKETVVTVLTKGGQYTMFAASKLKERWDARQQKQEEVMEDESRGKPRDCYSFEANITGSIALLDPDKETKVKKAEINTKEKGITNTIYGYIESFLPNRKKEKVTAERTLVRSPLKELEDKNVLIKKEVAVLDELILKNANSLYEEIKRDLEVNQQAINVNVDDLLLKQANSLREEMKAYMPKRNNTAALLKNLRFLNKSMLQKINLMHDEIKQLITKRKKMVELIDDLTLQKIILMQDEIKWHSKTRVDLFLYLLVAVYCKYVLIERRGAKKQHGIGSTDLGTNACHSSLFTKVRLFPIRENIPSFFSQSAIPTFKETAFDESLNMTVELDRKVNEFDEHLEGMFGKKSIQIEACERILVQVTIGEIDPIAGLNKFLKVMDRFFEGFKSEYFELKSSKNKSENKSDEENKININKLKTKATPDRPVNKKMANEKNSMTTVLTPLELPKTFAKIWELEREGTFACANEDLTAKAEYIYLMLRVKEKDLYKAHYLPAFLSGFNGYYNALQEEIFNTKFNLHEEIKRNKVANK